MSRQLPCNVVIVRSAIGTRKGGNKLAHQLGIGRLCLPRDLRAQSAETLVDPFVSALDLTDIVDRARSFGTERGEDHRMQTLPDDPVMRRWWEPMKDIKRANPDGSPIAMPLTEMFHLP